MPDSEDDTEALDCSGKNLRVAPDLRRYGKLTTLDLSNNKIKSLPRWQLEHLTVCNLASNEFTELPDLGGLLVLEKLNLDNNRITFLRKGRLPASLKELSMANNQIASASDVGLLPEGIQCLTLTGNPCMSPENVRSFIYAQLSLDGQAELEILDGIPISEDEKLDAEKLFFVKGFKRGCPLERRRFQGSACTTPTTPGSASSLSIHSPFTEWNSRMSSSQKDLRVLSDRYTPKMRRDAWDVLEEQENESPSFSQREPSTPTTSRTSRPPTTYTRSPKARSRSRGSDGSRRSKVVPIYAAARRSNEEPSRDEVTLHDVMDRIDELAKQTNTLTELLQTILENLEKMEKRIDRLDEQYEAQRRREKCIEMVPERLSTMIGDGKNVQLRWTVPKNAKNGYVLMMDGAVLGRPKGTNNTVRITGVEPGSHEVQLALADADGNPGTFSRVHVFTYPSSS
ncbi:unnamed protein product, partial [Mesorhabditis spiculigera]